MPTKTTTKTTARKAPARKAAAPAAAAKSSPAARAAAKPAKTAKTSKSKTQETVSSALPVTETAPKPAPAVATPPSAAPKKAVPPVKPMMVKSEAVKPVVPATRSAFAPITGRKPAEPKTTSQTQPPAVEKPASETSAKPMAEAVSLIDPRTPKPKRAASDTATKNSFLPPISKIREAHVAAPEPVVLATAEATAPAVAASSSNGEAEIAEDGRPIIHIKPPIVVKDLATQLGVKNFQLIKELMDDFNIFANPNLTVEPEVASKICDKHGFVFEMERREKGGGVHKQVEVVVAPPPPVIEKEEELKLRGPIITFMGHVDHGKTSLMDAIRKTRVAAGEAGGITQHIGAYTVNYKGTRITFLDTPGHAAFTAMRARGANVTDIVVLVVAADDGLMPQTIEAINHAKAAPHVKIMVAVNKMDLPGANLDRVKQQLQERDLTPEDWGGETIVVPVSATKGTGVDQLLENMAVQAEVMELKASPTATPRGTVIEAQVEPGRGPTATVIVQMGTLKVGEPFICGDYGGKIKSLVDDHGKPIKSAGPSTPTKVLGFTGLPNAGDEFLVMESEKSAKTLSEERLAAKRTEKLSMPQRATLESLLEAADGKKVLRLILKCDAQGSLEALIASLGQIESKKIDLEMIHAGVGPISESDILLASASNAVVVGFNIKVESNAVAAAKHEGVQVKLYSIIYELIDQMKEAMAGMLDPEHRESVIGHAEVKQVFQLSRGIVAGCLVTDGRISRTARARVLRRRQPVYDGGLSTLRRFQDDVKEVRVGLECGIKLGDFTEYQVGDIIECYQLEQVAQKL
ncbi:MAG: translation initiation factor IF-2 [Chthoniobacterales bacterium]|nr:translation initiation factor IF-2 [Chthoniobacterales bacterium]